MVARSGWRLHSASKRCCTDDTAYFWGPTGPERAGVRVIEDLAEPTEDAALEQAGPSVAPVTLEMLRARLLARLDMKDGRAAEVAEGDGPSGDCSASDPVAQLNLAELAGDLPQPEGLTGPGRSIGSSRMAQTALCMSLIFRAGVHQRRSCSMVMASGSGLRPGSALAGSETTWLRPRAGLELDRGLDGTASARPADMAARKRFALLLDRNAAGSVGSPPTNRVRESPKRIGEKHRRTVRSSRAATAEAAAGWASVSTESLLRSSDTPDCEPASLAVVGETWPLAAAKPPWLDTMAEPMEMMSLPARLRALREVEVAASTPLSDAAGVGATLDDVERIRRICLVYSALQASSAAATASSRFSESLRAIETILW
mmetsp:Transcript_13144/g.50290  ORF Transcript_13144/g.50290 Transcript_13144/m.50290 type:complete len:373 (+) Transcript_13144:191-1309(+)